MVKIKKNKRKKRTTALCKHQGVASIPHLLTQAIQLHQKGQLQTAQQAYKQIINIDPSHITANHNLGLLALQTGNAELACQLLKQVIDLQPDFAEAHFNLGNAYASMQSLDKAALSFQKALSLKPSFFEASINLGNTFRDLQNYDQSILAYKDAIKIKPNLARVHFNLANVYKDQGNYELAVKSYKQALSIQPNYSACHSNLGNLYREIGDLTNAVPCFVNAIKYDPNDDKAHNNLGILYKDSGQLKEAIFHLQKAIALNPEDPYPYCNLGNAYQDIDQIEKAIPYYEKAIKLKPDYPKPYSNLGNAYTKLGQLEKSIEFYKKALSINPDYVSAYYNLGNTFHAQGYLDKASHNFQKALSLNPDHSLAFSNLLFSLNYLQDIKQKSIFEKSLEWGNRQSQTNYNWNTRKKINNRLKVGYVSADFKKHSVAYFIKPLLEAHNRDFFHISCYSNVAAPDIITNRMQELSDNWVSIVDMKTESIADQIVKDKIDILVDLSGHTANNCLKVFALKPAPIQVSWLGYPNTTGLQTIDYRFTDSIADPVGEADTYHSETLYRLEGGFLCYQPPENTPEIIKNPCIENQFITFGSFNNSTKVNPEVVYLWSKILQPVNNSRLILKSKQFADPSMKTLFLSLFEQYGVSADRVEIYGRISNLHEHLNLYNKIDIGLDPFPYNGTTTTFEALWMGVPVITLRGDRHSGCVGASIMYHLGIPELIAETKDQYVEKAISLSKDLDRLRCYRSNLRQALTDSSYYTATTFADKIEAAYQDIWDKYCKQN